jgi:hypothetical protein
MPDAACDPTVTFEREDGKIVSAFVDLRPGVKSVGMIQPNPAALVFFLIGPDGLPVGIQLFERVSGVAACEIIDTLVEAPAGPEEVERHPHHFLLTPADLRRCVRGLKQGLEGLSLPDSEAASRIAGQPT